MTVSIICLFVTLGINDTQLNKKVIMLIVMLSVSHLIYCYAECHCVECRYAECRGPALLTNMNLGDFQTLQLITEKYITPV